MCRIDAPFGDRPLDEKKDPTERFLQVLDESNVTGNFRTLLIKHLSVNWIDVFYNASNLEEALSCAKKQSSEPEKCIAILLYKNINFQFRLKPFLNDLSNQNSLLLDFLNDVADTYFSGSPFGLYQAGMEQLHHNYFLFVHWLHGEEYFFTKEFFADKSLNSISKRDRTAILWSCFYSMAPQIDGLKYNLNASSLLKELASSNVIQGPLTKGSFEILRGLEFIKAWITFDSQAGLLPYDKIRLFYHVNSPLTEIGSQLYGGGTGCEDTSGTLIKWLDDTKLELEKLLYVNANLDHASDVEVEQWANGLNSSFHHLYKYIDFNLLEHDDYDVRMRNGVRTLCSQLTPLQINTWINWSIKDDFRCLLNSNQLSPTLSNSTEKWGCKEYFGTWKGLFLENINELELESQLCILSASSPVVRGEGLEFRSMCYEWWNGLLSNFIEKDNIPKKLIPDWTIIVINRFERENLLPYIDKSIGILRGELSQTKNTEEELKFYHQQLETLLTALDKLSPEKGLRHRLQLMRSSTVPFSDESISKVGNPLNREYFNKWYGSLNQLLEVNYAYQTNGNRDVTHENYKQIQNDFFVTFSYELAEFCLSRLRLRKGEKAKDGKYNPNQVIEQSSIWRQGYLKALIELGFDLNGKVHKTVNFTKQSDPDEAVRAIASECYKTVRRKTKKNLTIQDLKRGIIAAEWWLLLCQRKELGLEVNYEDALKTRRNLMRNP